MLNKMFEKRGKYWYKAGGDQPYELKKCIECGKEALIRRRGVVCSMECAGKAGTKTKIQRGSYTKVHYILAVDPGSTNVGYAVYEHEGKQTESTLVRQGIVHFDSLVDFLKEMSYITHLVYERYRIRPGGRQNIGTDGKVMQAIGKLDMWAASLGIPASTQEPSILPIAAKIVGRTLPKGHLRDDISAELHGAYWLRQRNWYVSALEREKKAS